MFGAVDFSCSLHLSSRVCAFVTMSLGCLRRAVRVMSFSRLFNKKLPKLLCSLSAVWSRD